MFPDVFDEFFSQVTAGFGCRFCYRMRALSINKTVMYTGESGPLKCEVVVKVYAMNAQVCMCTCV
jgi:phage-related baseplate assembly protein